jgi:hypothetical protein
MVRVRPVETNFGDVNGEPNMFADPTAVYQSSVIRDRAKRVIEMLSVSQDISRLILVYTDLQHALGRVMR